MARIMRIIPKGIRINKKTQAYNCLKNDKKNIQQRIEYATKAREKLEIENFEHNKNLKNCNFYA